MAGGVGAGGGGNGTELRCSLFLPACTTSPSARQHTHTHAPDVRQVRSIHGAAAAGCKRPVIRRRRIQLQRRPHVGQPPRPRRNTAGAGTPRSILFLSTTYSFVNVSLETGEQEGVGSSGSLAAAARTSIPWPAFTAPPRPALTWPGWAPLHPFQWAGTPGAAERPQNGRSAGRCRTPPPAAGPQGRRRHPAGLSAQPVLAPCCCEGCRGIRGRPKPRCKKVKKRVQSRATGCCRQLCMGLGARAGQLTARQPLPRSAHRLRSRECRGSGAGRRP